MPRGVQAQRICILVALICCTPLLVPLAKMASGETASAVDIEAPGYPIAEPWKCPKSDLLPKFVRDGGGYDAGVGLMQFGGAGGYRGLGATRVIKEGEVGSVCDHFQSRLHDRIKTFSVLHHPSMPPTPRIC